MLSPSIAGAGEALFKSCTVDVNVVAAVVVLGCADLDSAPDGATISRHGNTTVIRCVTSSLRWSLVCDGKQWTGPSQQCPSSAGLYGISLAFTACPYQ